MRKELSDAYEDEPMLTEDWAKDIEVRNRIFEACGISIPNDNSVGIHQWSEGDSSKKLDILYLGLAVEVMFGIPDDSHFWRTLRYGVRSGVLAVLIAEGSPSSEDLFLILEKKLPVQILEGWYDSDYGRFPIFYNHTNKDIPRLSKTSEIMVELSQKLSGYSNVSPRKHQIRLNSTKLPENVSLPNSSGCSSDDNTYCVHYEYDDAEKKYRFDMETSDFAFNEKVVRKISHVFPEYRPIRGHKAGWSRIELSLNGTTALEILKEILDFAKKIDSVLREIGIIIPIPEV